MAKRHTRSRRETHARRRRLMGAMLLYRWRFLGRPATGRIRRRRRR